MKAFNNFSTLDAIHPAKEAGKNIWLFNIKDDPNEKNELSEQMPGKIMELLDILAYYNSSAVPCRYPKPDLRSDLKLNGGYWKPWEDSILHVIPL